MATYVVSNKRILICGLNIDYLLIDLTSYQFGSDFSEKTCKKNLLEALQLNDNRFVRHTRKFENLQFARYSELLAGVSLRKQFCMA